MPAAASPQAVARRQGLLRRDSRGRPGRSPGHNRGHNPHPDRRLAFHNSLALLRQRRDHQERPPSLSRCPRQDRPRPKIRIESAMTSQLDAGKRKTYESECFHGKVAFANAIRPRIRWKM